MTSPTYQAIDRFLSAPMPTLTHLKDGMWQHGDFYEIGGKVFTIGYGGSSPSWFVDGKIPTPLIGVIRPRRLAYIP